MSEAKYTLGSFNNLATYASTHVDELRVALESETKPKREAITKLMTDQKITHDEAYAFFLLERELGDRHAKGLEALEQIRFDATAALAQKHRITPEEFAAFIASRAVVVVSAADVKAGN